MEFASLALTEGVTASWKAIPIKMEHISECDTRLRFWEVTSYWGIHIKSFVVI